MTSEPPKKHSYMQKLWVPVVIVIGLAIGESISILSTSAGEYGPPRGEFGYFPHFQTDPVLQTHIVLTTVEVVEALVSYPLLIGYYGPVSLEPGLSSPSADVFTVCAYAVFLYLSLE